MASERAPTADISDHAPDLTRPAGSWGDSHGRKHVLILCMVPKGASTVAVGLLPTCRQAGVLDPTLFVILRLVQGFAVVEEISGAISKLRAPVPDGMPGFRRAAISQAVGVRVALDRLG